MLEVAFDRARQVRENRTALQTARLADRQHAFDETAARRALSPKRQFAVNDRRTKRSFRGVVGRFDALNFHERPKPFSMSGEFATHSHEARIAAKRSAQQHGVDGCPDGNHLTLKVVPRDFAIFVTPPDVKHQFDLPHQIMA